PAEGVVGAGEVAQGEGDCDRRPGQRPEQHGAPRRCTHPRHRTDGGPARPDGPGGPGGSIAAMPDFRLVSDFEPSGDQPAAIAGLSEGLAAGERFQTLLGITGSGKSATMAWT